MKKKNQMLQKINLDINLAKLIKTLVYWLTAFS